MTEAMMFFPLPTPPTRPRYLAGDVNASSCHGKNSFWPSLPIGSRSVVFTFAPILAKLVGNGQPTEENPSHRHSMLVNRGQSARRATIHRGNIMNDTNQAPFL